MQLRQLEGHGRGVMCRIVHSHLAREGEKMLSAFSWHNRGCLDIFSSLCVASPHGLSSMVASEESEFLQISSGLSRDQ